MQTRGIVFLVYLHSVPTKNVLSTQSKVLVNIAWPKFTLSSNSWRRRRTTTTTRRRRRRRMSTQSEVMVNIGQNLHFYPILDADGYEIRDAAIWE